MKKHLDSFVNHRKVTTSDNIRADITRYTVENVTKTRVVLADAKIHILGSYQVCVSAKKVESE